MPVLRIVAHPDPARWGETCALPQRSLILSREFAGFGGTSLGDPRVSRRHAELTVEGLRIDLRDLGSSNGTTVNGQPVDRVTLAFGDVIGIGDTFVALSQAIEQSQSREARTLIGDSPAMYQLRSEIGQVASSSATVLVLGETGTGKDLVAREIHRQSGRRGVCLALNCAAIPHALLESELFGHTKGAFSGASTAKIGLFEAADRGTIFLDEIGDMPLELQASLLRVLQNREVRPVGATQAKRIDVRVVAATNADMVNAVGTRRFRPDLYSRLSEWVLKLPPLRERREDIPALVRAFAPASIRQLSADLLCAFLAHTWPFNVRELENLVTLAALESGASALQLGPRVLDRLLEHQQIADTASRHGEISAPARHPVAERASATSASEPPTSRGVIDTGGPPSAALAGSEAALVPPSSIGTPPSESELRALLSYFRGNVYKVSAHIGKHRYQVYRWAKNLGLDVASYRTHDE